jgi:hypothetical protein
MSNWGVLYIVWGDRHSAVLDRSIASLKRHHPELPVRVFAMEQATDPTRPLLAKADMINMTPFENTLFLDADTVVLGRLDHGFRKAELFHLALSICECPWARRYDSVTDDTVEYNTGVLFFTQGARPVFQKWAELATTTSSVTRWMDRDGRLKGMNHNDQASFAVAVEQSGVNPFVLPFNWNFRPSWHRSFFAPVKIWHDYGEPPENLLHTNEQIAQGQIPPAYMEFSREA